MRDYGKIACEFWTSPTIQAASDDAKLLAAYLLTNHHCTMIGCYRLPDGYVADDLNWSLQRVAKGFGELLAKGFITRCEQSKYVWIVNYLAWNPLENPNQVKAAAKLFEKLPDSLSGKGDLAKAIGIDFQEPLRNPSETLPEPVTVTVAGTVTGITTLSGKPDPAPKSSELKETAVRVIDFLNLKTGKAFHPKGANLDHVIARLRDGATEQDCKTVIARKVRDWKGDEKMAMYLRPETIFNRTKFASYQGECVAPQPMPWDGAK